MSWVPITAIQDLGENLRYLSPEDLDEVLNSLAVSRSYRGVTHYRLSDVERALQQLPSLDPNVTMYIRGSAITISNGNNGNNGGQRPWNNGNGNGNRRPTPINPVPPIPMPVPSSEGGVFIYLDANTFRNLFRPCQ